MTIELNVITAAEAFELGTNYRDKADEQLKLFAANIVSEYIMPRIVKAAKRNRSIEFTKYNHCTYNFDPNNYFFDCGFIAQITHADETENFYYSTDDVMQVIIEIMKQLGYTYEEGYSYSAHYYKDYDFTFSWGK